MAESGSLIDARRAVVTVVGHGVVGNRIQKLLARGDPARRITTFDTRTADVGDSALLDRTSVAVLAHPGQHHHDAVALLDRGISVVSLCDHVDDAALLMGEGRRAEFDGATLVVGAGMSPGLTGLIARHLADQLAAVDEIHIAIHGTAGPGCARQHHRALSGRASFLHDGSFDSMRAGTGRELCWFPEPVGAYDCYRAEMPSPLVLHQVFPEAMRISARMSANRRDRFTSRLPMLTPPHGEGGVGAVRVEVRGSDDRGGRVALVAGMAEMVGTAAAATASAYTEKILDGTLPGGLVLPGDQAVDTVTLMRNIERFGVRLQEFTGVPSA